MRKFRSLYIALLVLLMFSGNVLAAANLFSVKQDDGDEIKFDSDGKLHGDRENIEVATTNDTVTTAESGKVFMVSPTSGSITMTLPTAATGLQYSFMTTAGHPTAGQGLLILNPQSTDTFVGCVSSTTTTTFAAGDDLDSPQATGDSVTIVSGAANTWHCTNRSGTWVDGN